MSKNFSPPLVGQPRAMRFVKTASSGKSNTDVMELGKSALLLQIVMDTEKYTMLVTIKSSYRKNHINKQLK